MLAAAIACFSAAVHFAAIYRADDAEIARSGILGRRRLGWGEIDLERSRIGPLVARLVSRSGRALTIPGSHAPILSTVRSRLPGIPLFQGVASDPRIRLGLIAAILGGGMGTLAMARRPVDPVILVLEREGRKVQGEVVFGGESGPGGAVVTYTFLDETRTRRIGQDKSKGAAAREVEVWYRPSEPWISRMDGTVRIHRKRRAIALAVAIAAGIFSVSCCVWIAGRVWRFRSRT